jgi:hypothetical protein
VLAPPNDEPVDISDNSLIRALTQTEDQIDQQLLQSLYVFEQSLRF